MIVITLGELVISSRSKRENFKPSNSLPLSTPQQSIRKFSWLTPAHHRASLNSIKRSRWKANTLTFPILLHASGGLLFLLHECWNSWSRALAPCRSEGPGRSGGRHTGAGGVVQAPETRHLGRSEHAPSPAMSGGH